MQERNKWKKKKERKIYLNFALKYRNASLTTI